MTSRRARPIALAAGLLLALLAALAAAQVAVPPLTARVTDLTGTLAPAERTALEERLAALEQRKGAQIAVLLLPSTQPETIEQYAIRVFDTWKLGRQGVDDGVLLLVAKADRKVRIEVGRGLEGAIPDVTAHRIIDEYLTPRFREGDFAGGIGAGVDALQKLVDGEALPAPYRSSADGEFTKGRLTIWFWLTVLLSVSLGGLPWFLRLSLVGSISAFSMFVIGVATPWFIFAGIGSALVSLWMGNAGRFVRGGGSGGWSGGGSLGGWSSGSSSGGWSGGGGSSAGGGASGSW